MDNNNKNRKTLKIDSELYFWKITNHPVTVSVPVTVTVTVSAFMSAFVVESVTVCINPFFPT